MVNSELIPVLKGGARILKWGMLSICIFLLQRYRVALTWTALWKLLFSSWNTLSCYFYQKVLRCCRRFYTIFKNYEFWLYSKQNERVKGKEFCLHESLQFTHSVSFSPSRTPEAGTHAKRPQWCSGCVFHSDTYRGCDVMCVQCSIYSVHSSSLSSSFLSYYNNFGRRYRINS